MAPRTKLELTLDGARSTGLAMADAIVYATAQNQGAEVVTAYRTSKIAKYWETSP